MAKNTFADLDVTPANNTDLLNSNASGTAEANTIDTLIQNFAGMTARFYGDIGGLGTVGGSANAITLTSLSTYQALEDGLIVAFKAGAANTGATTLNLDGLGAKAVRLKGDSALAAGEIAENGHYNVRYDAAYNSAAGAWVLLNPETQRLDADLTEVSGAGVSVFSGLLYGLTLSNNSSDATNDLDIAAGIAIDGTNAKFLKLDSGITKRLDASWAVGTGNGGLDTGSIANTTYHMWLIMRSDTGVVDVLFSASASSPTMPTDYDYKRRIGSIVRTGGAIKAFTQTGDNFVWSVPVNNVNAAPLSTSAQTATLTVPTGIAVDAIFSGGVAQGGSAGYLLFTSLAQTDTTPTSSVYDIAGQNNEGFGVPNNAEYQRMTNTSAQIRYRCDTTDGDFIVVIVTRGWVDTRGRLA